MSTQIQIRRDTAANWASSNPVLAQGELGLDLTTAQIRIGDGSSNWADLLVYSPGLATVSTLPGSPAIGTRYYLDTDDDTAQAGAGIWIWNGTYWEAAGDTSYTLTPGATITLAATYGGLRSLTPGGDWTFATFPFAYRQAGFVLHIDNSGAHSPTWPANVPSPPTLATGEYLLLCQSVDGTNWQVVNIGEET